MSYVIPKQLASFLAQSDAAALAVICAHVRKEYEDQRKDDLKQAVVDGRDVGDETEDHRETMAFLQELESVAVHSIAKNDGNVVYWIGAAAKQMNPILS